MSGGREGKIMMREEKWMNRQTDGRRKGGVSGTTEGDRGILEDMMTF